MQCVLFYFSGTGNTAWAAHELTDCIHNSGHTCQSHSLEEDLTDLDSLIKDSDRISFAFPVYGASMPPIMKRFIERLGEIPSAQKKAAFIITTAGFMDALGPIAAGRILKTLGLQLVGYTNIKLCSNVSTPKMPSSPISDEALKERMVLAKEKINVFARRITTNKKCIHNIGPQLLPGIIIRSVFHQSLQNQYKAWSVDPIRCNRCMQCVTNCPTKCITFADESFTFSPSCTACMRCYNTCPTNAILEEGKYADPQIHKRYRGPKEG